MWKVLFKFLASLFLVVGFGHSYANVSYDSFAEAVERAQAQAYVYLKRGEYVTRSGNTSVTWTIPTDVRALVRFRYGAGTIQDGLIDFSQTSTFAVLRNQSGLCTRFEIKKIVVLPGGAISPDSEVWMRPNPQCRQQHSPFQFTLEEVFSLQPESRKLFKGVPFSGQERICRKGTPGCFSRTSAPSPDTSPVSRIAFFTSTDATTGEPTAEAFSVGLKPRQRIELPNGSGFIRLGNGSGVNVRYATFDVASQRGSGTLQQLRTVVDEGALKFGSTSLVLGAGSSVSLDEIAFEANGDTKIIEGVFEGQLSDGTVIRLADGTRDSFLTVQSARVLLNGINMDFLGSSSTLSGSSGTLELITKSSRLHFSEDLLLLLEGANLKLSLGCPAGAPSDCKPFKWGAGKTEVVGQLLPAQVTLANGGFIGLPRQNKLLITGGDMLTDVLSIDSRRADTPIVGKLQKLDLRFQGQNWNLDDGLTLKTVQLRLSSSDLGIVLGDRAPVGTLDLNGGVTDIEARGVGTMQVITGSSRFAIKIRRDANDDPRVLDATLDARVRARSSLESSAEVALRLFNVQQYRGFGSGKLDFSLENATAVYRTPGTQQEEGVPGGRFKINSYSIPIRFELASPVGFKAADIKVVDGVWSFPNIAEIPVGIRVDIPGMVGAKAQHQIGGGDLAGGNYTDTSCRPEVKTIGKSYLISGKVDLGFASSPRVVNTKDFTLNEPFQFDVDSSDCKTVAFISCGLVASAISGGNVLLGGAAGLACGKKVEDAKNDLENSLRTESFKQVSNLNMKITVD